MQKLGPERSDSLEKAIVKIATSECLLTSLAQIVIKTPTLAHLHVYDPKQTSKILQSLRVTKPTWQGEIHGDSKIIIKLPKHLNDNETKELVDQIRKVHQAGANLIDVVRKKAQNYIDKVRGDPKWHKNNSAILKNAAEKATSSLTKLSRELVNNLKTV